MSELTILDRIERTLDTLRPYIASHRGNVEVVDFDEGDGILIAGGEVSDVASGFTTVLGLDFDPSGRMYVLENSSVSGDGPTPMTGRVVRTILRGVTIYDEAAEPAIRVEPGFGQFLPADVVGVDDPD